MPMEMIEGAAEYYEYTKGLSQEEAYALNAEKVPSLQKWLESK